MSKTQEAYTNSNGAEYLGLKPPYTQAFGITAKHQLNVTNLRNTGGVLLYAQDYSAKKAIEILIGDDEYSLIKGKHGGEYDTLITSTGVKIHCVTVQELLNYKYTGKEELWQFGEPELNKLKYMRISSIDTLEEKTPNNNEIKEKPIKEQKIKLDKSGYITVGQIAEEMGIEAKTARIALRKAKIEKPSLGWCWDESQVSNIKKIIKDNL